MKTARERFLEEYAAGERNFAGIRFGYRFDLEGVVLRDINLCGADLSEVRLDGADLTGAKMRGVLLRDAWLRNAVLRNVDLEGACLNGARCNQTIFDNVNMRYVNAFEGFFIETKLKVALEQAILLNANFKGARFVDGDELIPEGFFTRPDKSNFVEGAIVSDGYEIEDWDWYNRG